MGCHHPIRAWRTSNGNVLLNREAPDAEPLALPCGGCLGCRTSAAQSWALRCHLELHDHKTAVFCTLTYDEAHQPPTLSKQHYAAFIKRLRTNKARRTTATALARIRHFGSGEYGETTGRPHYHAILFGLSTNDAKLIQDSWKQGYTRTDVVTPARIAYCAGYTSKKIGFKRSIREQVDPDTGEVYEWQPPFIQMSRNPGIGGNARKYTDSWRAYAVLNGQVLPVPTYLHDAWKQSATAEQQEQLAYEKQQYRQGTQITYAQLAAKEEIAVARQRIKADKRKY